MEFTLKQLKQADGSVVDLTVRDGVIVAIVPVEDAGAGFSIFPGFADVHVHLREPGFSYKETIRTGTMAAAHGGYTDVCAMPNLNPVPDTAAHLAVQQALIARDAVVRVHPYGAITEGQRGERLAALAELAGAVLAFSDDGRGVQDAAMMRAAMVQARSLGKMIVAHCEDNRLLRGGYIHEGAYAAAHGHRGICAESEWGPIARDLKLVEETGCVYHVCHVSTRQSVALLREAKKKGLNVTCETAPHYLLLDDSMLQDEGSFKMNPPLRGREDRQALLEGIADGTIDMIATDHAPHSAQEKAGGLAHSANGIVGLETAFPLLYTGLVRPGHLSLARLIALLHERPCARFGIGVPLAVGQPANFTVFDLNASYRIEPERFLSMGHATPFAGWTVYGRCVLTVCDGRTVWKAPEVEL